MIGVSACGGRVLNQHKYAEQQAVGGPFDGKPVRHLMYFVCPMGDWRAAMQPMLDRMSLFNGRRILAIAYRDTNEIKSVERFCGQWFDELLPCANMKEMREVVAWLPCLERLLDSSPRDCIFSAHAKGVTHFNDPVILKWINEMYEINLDYWPAVEEALTRGAMCGAFRRTGKFPRIAHVDGEQSDYERWHYSGTFYWMRSKDLFARNWRNMDWTWYGTESYPGVQFSPEQCQCLVGDNCGDLYQPETWDQLQPEIDKWKSANAANHRSRG